jgi:CDP-diacylglycerol--serine O-phosphatidyltransferase
VLNAVPSSRLLRSGVPACLTLGSMLCGYLSVAYTLNGSFTTAAWLIVCSGVLDAIDGPLARALRGATDFGRELDSFADLVSFGVAPSLLLYHAYFLHWGVPGMLVSFLPTMMGALRLTRYNITTTAESRDYFMGFTSTGSGNLLASFVLFSHQVWNGRDVAGLAAGLVVVSSILMASRIRYSTLARFACGGLWIGPKGALCLIVGCSLALFRDKAFFPAMTLLMLEGMLSRPIGQAVRQVGEFRRQHRGA